MVARAQRKAALLCGVMGLLAGVSAAPVRAEDRYERMEREIAELKAQIRAITKAPDRSRRNEARRVRGAAKSPAPVSPAAAPLTPWTSASPGTPAPAFVSADKRMQFGAITITPGGFVAAEGLFRSRTTQSDFPSEYRAIPFANSPLHDTNEKRLSARQTRVALLAEGAITPRFLAAGYLELDFLGAAQNANSNEASGYNPRIRHLYGTLDDSNYGLSVLGGQAWSLITLNSKGITPRNEITPPTIEAQYLPGFTWARQAQIRLTKNFDKRLWLSIAAEESVTTFAGGCTTAGAAGGATPLVPSGGIQGVTSIACGANGTGGGFSNLTTYSLNRVPDIVGKVAYEAKLGERDIHLEAYGLYRNFYDNVTYAGGRSASLNTSGYGVGAGLVVPVIPRRLDFQLSGLYGPGIGRYGSAQLADTTFNRDGSLKPIEAGMVLGGLTWHATPAIDVYAFAGIEKLGRTFFRNPDGSYVGVGSPSLAGANAGCNTRGSTACASSFGNTRQIWQVTGGLWDKIYKGSYGEVRVGMQYSYTKREIFAAPGAFRPQTDDHMAFTSLRYYPFQ